MEEIEKIIRENDQILKSIMKLIEHSEKIAIIGHVDPDGDCVGSQMGLHEGLKAAGKKSVIINEGPFKGIYKDFFEKYFQKDIIEEFDLFIIVDATDGGRIGKLSAKVDFHRTIVLDHHITNTDFGKINWVNDNFISTSEIVFLLLYKMGINFQGTQIAQYLLNGILSDNGFFQHIRRKKSLSLIISYYLIELGGDPKKSYDLMFRNNTIESEKLLALVLSRLESLNNGKILWTYVYEEEKMKLGNPNFESGLLFKEMKSIIGSEIAVFFKVDTVQKKVDISFRSTDKHDISVIAQSLGGGGHKVAAGAHVSGEFENIKRTVFEKLDKIFQEK
jgi:bifunctional oligoribonuclease and PAP phosphatase NrnA